MLLKNGVRNFLQRFIYFTCASGFMQCSRYGYLTALRYRVVLST